MKKFSIIAVDYEKHVPREGRHNIYKGLQSIANQTFKDFELIICHDGPKEIPYEKEIDFKYLGLDPVIINTPQHMGNYGHHSRDYAMRQATGEYFVQFNIDNKLYPNALEKIAKKLDESEENVLIFAATHAKWPLVPLMYGVPPKEFGIDVINLVAHRDVWEDVGYWYNYTHNGDGIIYEAMCKKHKWTFIPECLGENY